MQNNNKYHITIAGSPHIERGVYKAVLFYDTIEIVFFENNPEGDHKEIKRVSLSPDRVSFGNSLQRTKHKISLICQRLGIDEKALDFDSSSLPSIEKIRYKALFLAKMLYKMFIPMQWVIVYKKIGEGSNNLDGSNDNVLGNTFGKNEETWHKIIPPKEVFQADPFVIYKDNKHYVFFEELKFEDYHGYLAVAELDTENGKLINTQTIMKLDYHLSYPFVFQENGVYYMIPESGDNKTIDLYECTSFPAKWEKKQTLLENIQAVDTTLLKKDASWYLFTNEKIEGADYDDELSIYKSGDLLNQPFEKLYDQPVIADVMNARMAGKFIQKDGEIFRVSQDGGKRYGYRANINKVLQIENGYKEEKLSTIKPGKRALGFHTYNEDHGIAVGDQLIARFDLYSLRRFIGGNLKRVLFS